jgi:hypothetical protein
VADLSMTAPELTTVVQWDDFGEHRRYVAVKFLQARPSRVTLLERRGDPTRSGFDPVVSENGIHASQENK